MVGDFQNWARRPDASVAAYYTHVNYFVLTTGNCNAKPSTCSPSCTLIGIPGIRHDVEYLKRNGAKVLASFGGANMGQFGNR